MSTATHATAVGNLGSEPDLLSFRVDVKKEDENLKIYRLSLFDI